MFFFYLNWKRIKTLSIFYALFVCSFSYSTVAEKAANKINMAIYQEKSQTENDGNLQRKLSSVLLKTIKNYEAQKKILLDLETLIQNGRNEKLISTLNKNILESFNRNIQEGNHFVQDTMRYCNFMYDKIDNLPIPNDEKLRLEVRVDELKAAAERFAIGINYSANSDQQNNWRILDVNDDLGVVVIPGGYMDGIRIGRVFYIPEADNAEVTVVSVRQFICAAIVIKGQLSKIVPGMTAEVTQDSK